MQFVNQNQHLVLEQKKFLKMKKNLDYLQLDQFKL